MPFLSVVALVMASGIISWSLTGVVRRYAVRHAMLDVPNERSSHVRPTPRGGGIAIAAGLLLGLAAAGALGWLSPRLTIALVGGGLAVAMLGWLDDRRGLGPASRLAVHAAAATWAVAWLGAPSLILARSLELQGGIAATVLSIFVIVWMTNLYNFMDGIDGLAAGQALVAGGIGGLMLLAAGDAELALAALVVAAAAGGFLPWNWAPARIFMGDVSSGLLGFTFGTMAIAAAATGRLALVASLILLGAFVFDATVTLLRRVARGDRWYAAHRLHAYQRLVQSGWSHSRTSTIVLLVALALGGIAAFAASRPALQLPALAIAALLLTVAYLAVEWLQPMSVRRLAANESLAPSPDAAPRSHP